MKVIVLGDTHGRSLWKGIAEKELESCNKFIMIGDYFDTHNNGYSPNRQIANFKDIIAFKKANMDKVVLLIGNHDYHYMTGVDETYSRYNQSYATDINIVLEAALNEGLLQMCFVSDKYVFTHAGVTKTWAKANDIDLNDFEKSINDLFNTRRTAFGFTIGLSSSNSGNDITQTPIWVRLPSLDRDIIDNVVCVVGHTPQLNIDVNYKIIAIDTLGTSEEYLIIENNIPKVGKLLS
jgi:predicted phosphodiesterase